MSEAQAPHESRAETGQIAAILDTRQAERRTRWDKAIVVASGVGLTGLLITVAAGFLLSPDNAALAIAKAVGKTASTIGIAGVVAGNIGRYVDKPSR